MANLRSRTSLLIELNEFILDDLIKIKDLEEKTIH